MPRFRRSVRVGDIVTLQSPDMGSISASCVGGTCRADLLEGPVQMPPNIRDCRFQVYPHFRYVCRDALRKLELGGVTTGHRTRILRSNAEAEEENNRREFENLLGAEVRHGMVIQLLHLSTGKFLTAGQAIARLERDCFRISLSEGDRNSGWGVCPVFQFQQSGHPLQYQDDFYLEATGKRGFLHISDSPDQTAVSLSHYIKDTFEVNCATSRNRLRFSPYRDCQVHASKEASGCLYGDDVVSIQLREHGSVLAATISGRGCQAEEAGPRVFFAADCKSRLQAATVWKIESAELQQAGDAVAPLRAFRVKHVASGLYMALANPGREVQEICLTSDYHSADGSTLWEFVPVNEEEFIHRSTPLYIRNVCTDCWLQGQNVQGASLGAAGSICCEELDVSQYVNMAPAVEKDDTTAIDRMRNFRLQVVDVIKALRCCKDASPRFAALPEYADAVSTSLGKCIRLCVGGGEENPLLLDGDPQAESQHLVHEMGVLQAVVDLIECLAEPFQLDEREEEEEEGAANPEVPPGPASILRLAYWLVKQACKGRQEVKGFLLAHLDMFTRHLALNILASAALRELFSDNRQMLMDVPAETMGPIIDRLIRSYVRNRCPEILCIFESICVCEGAPVPAVQSRIVQSLLQRCAGALPTLRVRPPELRIVGPGLDEGGPLEVNPRDFLGRGAMQASSLDPQERVYCLCLCSLELFAALASGRHRQAAVILQKGPWSLSRATLVSIVKDFTCPSAFRRACLAVLEKLYIDHGEMKVIPAISYTRVWRDAVNKVQDDGPEERRHTADAFEERSLSEDNPTALTRELEPGRRHSDSGLAESAGHTHWQRLALLKHTSRTTSTLRRSAQVECSDMESMVNELHGILSGVIRLMEQTVAERGSQEASLHAFASAGDRVEDVRFASALLECIGLLANFGLLRLGDSREQALVRCVTDTLITFLSLPITSRPMQHCKISACSVLQRIFALRTDYRLTHAFEAYEHSWREPDSWPGVFQKLFKDLFETPIISEKVMMTNMGSFVDPLLYTISSGVELDVKSKCWNLLFLHTGQRAYMIREAMKVTVLALPEAVSVYHQVVQTVTDLAALMPDIVLSREVQTHCANKKACDLIASLTELCTPSGEDSSGGYLDNTVQKHQDVLRDLGAQRCLLQILRLPLRRRKVKLSLDEAVDTVRLDLFQRCYEFLQLFVHGNPQNQELMFLHIGLFMSHVGVERLDVGGLVAAIVEDNSALVAQMSDADLRTFVQAIAKYGKRARWLHTLQSMLRVKGQWIRRNQNVVLGLLLEDADLVLELDGHEEGALENEDESALLSRSPSRAPASASSRSILLREGNRTRLQLMAARDQDQGGSSFLLYHVTCLTLLANCCAGRNQSNQSKCRGLLSVDEVINSITSCHRDSFGQPAVGVDADTVRFVRGAWLKFLHHCLVDSAPHELFSCPEALWGEDDTSLTGVLLAEAVALGEALQAGEQPPSEQLDFVFHTCLPLYAGLVKGFAPRPLPGPARRLMSAVAGCCDARGVYWKESYLSEADLFFAAFSVVEGPAGLHEDASAAKEMLDVVSRSSRTSFLQGASEAHMQALDFREGFGRFVEGLSWSVSVNPAEVVGNGLRDLVAIIHGQEDLLVPLAEVLVREATGPSETTPFLMNCIRAVRGYLCGIQPVGVGPESNWQSFVNKEVPSDPELARRQEVAANAGLVASLASILVHSNMRIVREVLLTFQVFFASPSLKGQRVPQEALVRYVGGEAQRQHFVSACLEIIGKCMQDLRERELHLQTKLEQRLARRRALRRRWSSSGTESNFTAEDETSDSSSHDDREAMLEDGDLDLSSSPGFVDPGPPLELLTVLTSCLAGGRRELQDMLLVTDTAKALNQEDLLADLVKYVALSEKLVVTSLAQGHKGPLQIILQAFKFFQEVIRGPNARAVEALVLHTEIAVIIRDLLKQLRCAGPAMELKFKLRSQILTFTLDMLQNLGPGQTAMPRKLISQECDHGFLQAWEEAHEMATREERLNKKDVEQQCFLCYAVLAYLADASRSPALWREVAARAEAFERCRRGCGIVEVTKHGEALPLRFRLPPICEQLRSQEGFKSKVASLVYECIGDEELERARAALFLSRLTALIAKEVRHCELVGHGFLGALVGYQNWVRRLPLLATVLMNVWLLCFEAKLFSELMGQDTGLTEAVAAAHGLAEGEVCGGPEAAACLSIAATPGSAEVPSTRPPVSLLTAAMYGCELLVAAFHFVCYLLRFVLVLGTSTQRRERQVEFTLLFFSFLGNALSPFFFVAHMLEFFGAQSARMLLSAATLNFSKLGQAGLIIMLTVYLYAVVGFQLFKDKHTEGKCSTLLNCAMSYLDGGLTGNGIHEALELKTPRSLWGTPALEWLLQLFAMSFLAIHVQVLLAIFSGIIIDSFGELRDRHAEITSHLSEQSHLLAHGVYWNYVDFLVFLHVSEPGGLTDLEAYVYSQVEAGSSSWLPYRLSLDLQPGSRLEAEAQQQEGSAAMWVDGEQLEEVKARLDGLERRLDILAPDERSPEARRFRRAVTSPHVDVDGERSPGVWTKTASDMASPAVRSRLAKLERNSEERLAAVEDQLSAIRQLLEAATAQNGDRGGAAARQHLADGHHHADLRG